MKDNEPLTTGELISGTILFTVYMGVSRVLGGPPVDNDAFLIRIIFNSFLSYLIVRIQRWFNLKRESKR